MEMNGSQVISAPVSLVWKGLLDPEVLRKSVPGCQEMSGTPEDGFEAVVVQKVGPIKATFAGIVMLEDAVPLRSLTLQGEGKGGAAGFAKGGARVTLSDEDGATRLEYQVSAQVGGKLAQLGSRVIGGFARKMADKFFAGFKEAVEAGSRVHATGENNEEC